MPHSLQPKKEFLNGFIDAKYHLDQVDRLLNDERLTNFFTADKRRSLPVRLSEVRNALYKLDLEIAQWRAKHESL